MRRRRCGTPEASRRSSVVVVVLQQIFPRFFFYFPLPLWPTARARMFLICSRSFSLSRPPTTAGSPAPPPQSQESKVEKRILVATTLNFSSSREKPVRVLSCHGCRRRPRFCCVVRVLPRGSLVPDPDCVFYSHTHSQAHSH